MKVLILKHKVKVEVADDIQKAKEYFKEKGIDVEFDVKDTGDKADNIYLIANMFTVASNGIPYSGLNTIKEQLEYLKLVPDGYHACVFMWDKESLAVPMWNGKPAEITSWTNYSPLKNGVEFIQLVTRPLDDRVGWIWKSITHELLHAMCKYVARKGRPVVDAMDITDGKPYYKNDDPYATDGNYAVTLANLKPYLSLFEEKKEVGYKYFAPREIVGLKSELVELLDKAREIAGVPFVLTSGYRNPAKNKAVGGVEDSSHITGLAVDIRVKDGVSGGKILLALAQVGFTRFGFYKDNHIHVDMDSTKPNPCIWVK